MGSAPWAAALLPAMAVPTWGPMVLLSVATAFVAAVAEQLPRGLCFPQTHFFFRGIETRKHQSSLVVFETTIDFFSLSPVAQSHN